LRENSLFDSACIAADYTLAAIENTINSPEHWYGVRFEPVLPVLIEKLKKK
jgi:pyridoxine kinase